jgi:hypothetical protein
MLMMARRWAFDGAESGLLLTIGARLDGTV